MWGRWFIAGCSAIALACAAAPSFAGRALTSDAAYAADRKDAKPQPLFGSQEVFSDSIWRFPQWTDMLARSAAEKRAATQVCATAAETGCIPLEWQELIDTLRGLDLKTQIERVNAAMNRHPYVPTEQNWHRAMYWETPFEFLRRGGQCQDYAIAKYQLLRALGIPAALMRMVVLHDTALDLDHAVLAVYVDGEPMLLDNLRSDIVPAREATAYRPYYSINETGWWYHFGGRAMTQLAMLSR